MSTRKKSNNFVQRLLKQIWRFFDVATKAVVNRLLRSLFVSKRQSRLSRAGFVLPTVVMVILVVTLLTTAIMIRSFDRSKNASNVRVDQAVLNAARPAIDRARAKIDRLFSPDETELSGNTPPESNIADILSKPRYRLGDETQIELRGQFEQNPAVDEARTLNSAWKFPVDTDNNGKFDTFTLYGIYFRNPQTANNNENNRPRGTTEARALPQDDGQTDNCGSGASPEAGWYSIGGQLKKAFFTYVANVPITDTAGLEADKYETYTGNKGFSALEMQLDQTRIGLDNNAVWYQDDIALSSIPSLRLNGRVHTNSNLLVRNEAPITFLQVSSVNSCFYNPDNAKIVVGGNVAAGDIGEADSSNNAVTADLFVAKRTQPTTGTAINAGNKTTTLTPTQVAGNSDAYAQRLGVLVQSAIELHDTQNANAPTVASVSAMAGTYPEEVIESFKTKMEDSAAGSSSNVLKRTLESYFADRIRRVSFAEVASNAPVGTAVEGFTAFGPELQPPVEWMSNDVANTDLPLNINGSTMAMPASDPGTGISSNKREELIGDRVLVGNNLPRRWLKPDGTYAEKNEEQPIPGVNWNNGGDRTRKPVVEPLDDLGDTSRNGFWETAAAQKLTASGPTPGTTPDAELSGGLRIVTGAGIYIDGTPPTPGVGTGVRLLGQTPNANTRSFLPPPSLSSEVDKSTLPTRGALGNIPDYTVVWPDTMPMYRWKGAPTASRTPNSIGTAPYDQLKGDLQMRATVVYQYENGEAPLACVSSYYDPTDFFTADNDNGISNNGISYAPPASADLSQIERLRRQAKMVFPDGRWVNKPLYNALRKDPADFSFSDKSAIDAANCALSILDGTAVPDASAVPDGAIKERAFLDARQIKAIHRINTERDGTTPVPELRTFIEDLGNPDHLKVAPLGGLADAANQPLPYNLPQEQRQPLEVRVTEIDLDILRRTPAPGTNEYLLPNSGIIYATRDDALPDISCANVIDDITKAKTDPSFLCPNAATDFELDPTRRPNGIRLINGSSLEREQEYRKEEKGLILASDLPVYIKGDFNLHLESGTTNPLEEFTELATPANFYTRATKQDKFACRRNSPSCSGDVGNGDQWRAARILSDAITILSDNFRDGYRYEGDYDISNNAGNVAVESFLKNGFWNNSYATSADWYNTATANGLPRTDFVADDTGKTASSSYVTNSVTPIQRRVNNFPVYQMEICTKLPASECRPGRGPQKDWQLLGDTSTTVDEDLPTPATEIAQYNREHYPRRVAFQRDATTGQLVLDANGRAQPIKADGTPVDYDAPNPSAGLDRTQNHVLWYATTTSSNNSNPSEGIGYSANNLLYYAPDESETPTAVTPIVHERQLLLPGTPTFPEELYVDAPFSPFKGVTNQTILNGETETDPSDFAVCNLDQISDVVNSKNPAVTLTGGRCPSIVPIRRMRQALLELTNPTAKQLEVLAIPRTLDATASPGNLPPANATRKVNVFDLTLPPTGGTPNRQLADVTLTINGANQPDPIFIFRSTDGIGMRFENVQLKLNGVDPNNIFWVPKTGGITIAGVGGSSTLTGNFIGLGNLVIDDATNVQGGRFLGFRTTKIGGTLTALTTTAQPLLVPVLNLHSPTGTPGAANNDSLNRNWLPQAQETKVNAVLVMGDSPSRPLPFTSDNAEYNGGLANFPRFLEDWQQEGSNIKATKISGGFIQFKRSAVATAPFETITDSTQDIALFFDNTGFPPALTTFGAGFKYRGGASGQKAAYYTPPDRQWGYDVGLLSQTPDLYSRRFTSPQAQDPNEYFREVSRDDKWVNTLLCARVVEGGVATDPALPAAQRPTNCP